MASFLNFVRGVDQANLTPVRIGDDGTVCLFVNEGTEVVPDLNGYYTLACVTGGKRPDSNPNHANKPITQNP